MSEEYHAHTKYVRLGLSCLHTITLTPSSCDLVRSADWELVGSADEEASPPSGSARVDTTINI